MQKMIMVNSKDCDEEGSGCFRSENESSTNYSEAVGERDMSGDS